MKWTLLIFVMSVWVGAGFPMASHGETTPETQPEPPVEEAKRFPIVTRFAM